MYQIRYALDVLFAGRPLVRSKKGLEFVVHGYRVPISRRLGPSPWAHP